MKVKAIVTGVKNMRGYMSDKVMIANAIRDGIEVDIELPEPPKPEVKTPGQIVYEAQQDTRLVGTTTWLAITRDAKNKYHKTAHVLGLASGRTDGLPYIEPEESAPSMTPGEAAHAAFRRGYPGLTAPWERTSSVEKMAWECAAQDAITVGRGDRVTR